MTSKVSGVATHNRDKDDPLRGEVAFMQREGRRSRPGRKGPRRLFLDQTANTVGLFPRRQLFGEAHGRLWTAVGVTNERSQGRFVDYGACGHDSSF